MPTRIPLSKGGYFIVNCSRAKELSRYVWRLSPDGYVTRSTYSNKTKSGRGTQTVSRQILGLTDKEVWADHKNGDKLDNRDRNLRVSNRKTNRWNSEKQNNNTSGYKGVSWHSGKQKWIVKLRMSGKYILYKEVPTAKAGAVLYNRFAKKYHGRFARLNIIKD